VESRFDPVQNTSSELHAVCNCRIFFLLAAASKRTEAEPPIRVATVASVHEHVKGFFGRAAGESGSHVGRDRGTTRAARRGLRCESGLQVVGAGNDPIGQPELLYPGVAWKGIQLPRGIPPKQDEPLCRNKLAELMEGLQLSRRRKLRM